MKIRAFILAFIFLFGGSGISVDIAKCCDKISSVSINLKGQQDDKDACCAKIKAPKKKCCSEVSVHTVINPVPAIVKSSITKFKAPLKALNNIQEDKVVAFTVDRNVSKVSDFDHNYPVPILIRKRVLQI